MANTPTNLTSQVSDDYLAYAVATLSRAIPSLTDGLKPAQRRVLTAMKWLGLKPDGRYMKSARVEGETMGKLHPHGGAYGVMVTLAAPWNNNLPLIDGQGNWGSSTDGAAASRYTECKLTPFANDCLLADSETWQTQPNYDGSLQEPTELNVRVPLVLLNGQEGIGVGFATKIPPHSLRDICDAVTKGSLLTPSFPTGCDIVNDSGLTDYQRTGVGTLRLRARCEVATEGTGKRAKQTITFTNLPYGTNPEQIGQQIKDGLDKGNLAGITAVSDQSDLTGDRIAVVAKVGTDIDLLRRSLYHWTNLDTKYTARLLVVDGLRPVEMSPSQLIARWTTWRLDRLGVAFRHELDSRSHRLEIVLGLIKAIDKIDAVIKLIRSCESKKEALIQLVSTRTLKFTRDQAAAILEMRLHQLTGLDAVSLEDEKSSLEIRITELTELINNDKKRESFMKAEIKAIGTRHGEKRRSEIIETPVELTVQKSTGSATKVSRPKFMKIDTKKGVAEQTKGPRGALILEKTDKVITVTADGILRKIPSNFKGPLGDGYSQVFLAKKETEVATRRYLVVFEIDNQLKAMTVCGTEMAKTTSKGKKMVPEGAKIVHFDEKSFKITWKSPRKKPITLDLSTKELKPGAKGVKIANLADLA